MVVVQKCVFLLLVALALSDVIRAYSWREYLQYRREMEEQKAAEEEQAAQEQAAKEGGRLRSYVEQLRYEQEMLEKQAELEQAQMEEMAELIKDYNMDELSHNIGTDTLGRILRPLREFPTESPIEDCIRREWPMNFDVGFIGTIMYEACGSGDRSYVKMRIKLPGETTPAAETTVLAETTAVPDETTPPEKPTCPHQETNEEAEETTTEEPTEPPQTTTLPTTTPLAA